jgi:hypothetical protein
LSRTTSPVILRSILASARHITCLAFDYLEDHLVRFRSPRPRHHIDEDFKFRGSGHLNGSDEKLKVRAWELKSSGQYYEVRDLGPPSCVEGQRAIRACWRLQVF